VGCRRRAGITRRWSSVQYMLVTPRAPTSPPCVGGGGGAGEEIWECARLGWKPGGDESTCVCTATACHPPTICPSGRSAQALSNQERPKPRVLIGTLITPESTTKNQGGTLNPTDSESSGGVSGGLRVCVPVQRCGELGRTYEGHKFTITISNH
jgi:hypothetical protein